LIDNEIHYRAMVQVTRDDMIGIYRHVGCIANVPWKSSEIYSRTARCAFVAARCRGCSKELSIHALYWIMCLEPIV
jgi:hypothetical protein